MEVNTVKSYELKVWEVFRNSGVMLLGDWSMVIVSRQNPYKSLLSALWASSVWIIDCFNTRKCPTKFFGFVLQDILLRVACQILGLFSHHCSTIHVYRVLSCQTKDSYKRSTIEKIYRWGLKVEFIIYICISLPRTQAYSCTEVQGKQEFYYL